jgi:SAM-dependent methyltransferase
MILIVAFDVMMVVFLCCVLVYLIFASRNTVPPVMSPGRVIPEVLSALDLPDHGEFLDLGCGNGKVLRAVLIQKPKLTVIGVENNPLVLAGAWLRTWGRPKLIWGDIVEADISRAARVFVYLGPDLMKQLEPKFEQELSAGARVVSLMFPLPNRRPVRIIKPVHGKPHALYLYVYDY